MLVLPESSAAPLTSVQDRGAQRVAQEISDNLMSPYCPGRSISSCPSDAARKLELEILDAARSGQEKEEIEAALVARFGEEKVGSSYSTEVIVVVLLAAVIAVFVLLQAGRRWKKGSQLEAKRKQKRRVAGDAGEASQLELDQLEDALDDLEEF